MAGEERQRGVTDAQTIVDEILRHSKEMEELQNAAPSAFEEKHGDESDEDMWHEPIENDKGWTEDRLADVAPGSGIQSDEDEWADCQEKPVDELVKDMKRMSTSGNVEERIWSEEEIESGLREANKHKDEGNQSYQKGEYVPALDAYSKAIDVAPPKDKRSAVFWANRAACYIKLDDNDNVVDDCTKALDLDAGYVKALARRAHAYEAQEKYELALDDYKALHELDPHTHIAKEKIRTLPEQIRIHQEKMKDEMMGKLKDLGNTVLGKFGMSMDNFKMVQQPDGTYSINFQQ